MHVTFDALAGDSPPYVEMDEEHTLGVTLRRGFIEMGPRPSALRRVALDAGEIRLCTPDSEHWYGAADLDLLTITVSDAALAAACHAPNGRVELERGATHLADARVGALVRAVDAERVAGFPSGRLFLDSIEQALAVALVNGYAIERPSPVLYRGGLAPARLRRIKEFVEANIDGDLTLEELAESVNLSVAHFSEMFHKSTGHTPHQFVLRQRVERAKEILRTADARVLDVAVACGFKTQQHFARVFRQLSGISPTEYRQEFLH